MISMREILKDVNGGDIPLDHWANLYRLHYVSNCLRRAYNKPMIVTSGYRTREDHIRIYREKGVPEDQIPWGSQHLIGAAIDIADPKQELQRWLRTQLGLLERLGVYLESFEHTKNWVHWQIYQPVSGHRYFNP